MLTKEKNERLTRVGPGTPAGELLRRYWHPVCAASELTERKPKKKVRILGENLVVYRDDNGNYGSVAESCAHRGCSLYYGFIEGEEIRCPYHGWKYNKVGQCTEQPFEPKGSAYMEKIHQQAYPVQMLAGLLFVYMGPSPVPLLPRWGPLVREDGTRRLEVQPALKCNWLQIQENTVDSVHTYFLHGHMLKANGRNERTYYTRPIVKYEWAYCDWGIEKKLYYGGDNPGEEVRPPMIFPNILMITVGEGVKTLHWRVPVDDEQTMIFVVMFKPSADGQILEQPEHPPVEFLSEDTIYTKDGDYDLLPQNVVLAFYNQDRMAWETQGAVFERSREHLGASDRGIAMFRKLLEEQIDIVLQGGEPMVTLRNEEDNQLIDFEDADRPF